MNVTCNKCGWVHFTMTRAAAEIAVAEFNTYYATLDAKGKSMFGGESSIDQYDRCFFCGQTDLSNFRPSQGGDCPMGSTIQPIIQESK